MRETGIETYTLSYVKQRASGKLPYDAGGSKLVLGDNPEEQGGEGVRNPYPKEFPYIQRIKETDVVETNI